MQSLLSLRHELDARSSITGRRLTETARAYLVWHMAAMRWTGIGSRSRPLNRDLDYIRRIRRAAFETVQAKLKKRAQDHLDHARERLDWPRSRKEVLALRMRQDAGIPTVPHVIPAAGWHGLPGLYSPAWPTVIGTSRGEPTIKEAKEAVRRSPDWFEIVRPTIPDLQANVSRIRDAEEILDAPSPTRLSIEFRSEHPEVDYVGHENVKRVQDAIDEAAIAEEVAAQFAQNERSVETARKFLRRLEAEAREHEYRFKVT